ncbi:hypothetical protein BCR44DRAFT_44274 [Catenaria anguillulae PL171]|uniref:Uncharacterized protein n=1 Tax=Catenaria anguillulae PL171 TaxID=765915 RepID=A0A1Y2H451_9FUNG|nr:hypothetical protein BCR44DRAFT_44274 [Catenaria anguillulae PL171]
MMTSTVEPPAALGPLLARDLPAPSTAASDPADPAPLCDELATTHFGLHGILSSGFYVPAEAFSDRRPFQPAATASSDNALPAGLEMAVSTRANTAVLLHPVPAASVQLIAGFLPLTIGLPGLLPLHSVAADADAKSYLVATPYGRGSLREMLAEWSAIPSPQDLTKLPIRPTDRLILTWAVDVLQLVAAWHARLDLGTLPEHTAEYLADRVLPLAPANLYINPATLHVQLDVLPLLMDDVDQVDDALSVNTGLAVEVVQALVKAMPLLAGNAGDKKQKVEAVCNELSGKVNARQGVEEALSKAVDELRTLSKP